MDSYAGHDPVNVTDPTGLCLPRPGSSGTGSGSGSGSGGGKGSSGNGGGGGSAGVWLANFQRGESTLHWGLALLAFAALILSGPFGWATALIGTMTLAAGFASVGIGLVQMGTAHTRTEAQDLELNRGVSAATSISSGPGRLIGATIAAGTGHDPEKGAMIGGLTEGGLSLAKGLGEVALMEYRFWRQPKPSFYWKDVTLKVAVRSSMGPKAASQWRVNPLLRTNGSNTVEWIELSHFFSQKATKGWERLFNRPWNLKPMWGVEHARGPGPVQLHPTQLQAAPGGGTADRTRPPTAPLPGLDAQRGARLGADTLPRLPRPVGRGGGGGGVIFPAMWASQAAAAATAANQARQQAAAERDAACRVVRHRRECRAGRFTAKAMEAVKILESQP